MKRLLCILLSFVVFTACEDDKDTLPYPMNELDGTFWGFYDGLLAYYDENWTLLEQRPWAVDFYLYFKGNSVLDIVSNLQCQEGTYSISLKDQKFTIGKKRPYDLVEYNKSSFAYSYTGTSFDYECPGARYRVFTYWLRPAEPKMSWEEYIESYKRTGDYENVD